MCQSPSSQPMQEAIHQLFTKGLTSDTPDVTRALYRRGAQRLVQTLWEHAVADVLRRGPSEGDRDLPTGPAAIGMATARPHPGRRAAMAPGPVDPVLGG
jgi:hypothetical protein